MYIHCNTLILNVDYINPLNIYIKQINNIIDNNNKITFIDEIRKIDISATEDSNRDDTFWKELSELQDLFEKLREKGKLGPITKEESDKKAQSVYELMERTSWKRPTILDCRSQIESLDSQKETELQKILDERFPNVERFLYSWNAQKSRNILKSQTNRDLSRHEHFARAGMDDIALTAQNVQSQGERLFLTLDALDEAIGLVSAMYASPAAFI